MSKAAGTSRAGAPFVIPNLEDVAPELALADVAEVLYLPCEFAIQVSRLGSNCAGASKRRR